MDDHMLLYCYILVLNCLHFRAGIYYVLLKCHILVFKFIIYCWNDILVLQFSVLVVLLLECNSIAKMTYLCAKSNVVLHEIRISYLR